MTPANRAARGAAWLDQHRPGWYRSIRRPIEISSCDDCVLGQLSGDYCAGLVALHPGLDSYDLSMWARHHGMSGGYKDVDAEDLVSMYAHLSSAWEDEVAMRRTPCPAPSRIHAPDRDAIRRSWDTSEADEQEIGDIAALTERMISEANRRMAVALGWL